jgi:hypothetical protein
MSIVSKWVHLYILHLMVDSGWGGGGDLGANVFPSPTPIISENFDLVIVQQI